MAVLKIITPVNPTLRKKARKVTRFDDPKLQTLIDDMVDTMLDAPGVGLAAPQVEVSQRLIVVHLPDDEQSQEEYGEDAGALHIVLNPEIIRASRQMVDGVEACLSIPGYYGNVSRHQSITVRGQDREGKELRVKASGWLARVFQHEIDHLDGVLFIDKATEIWRMEDESDEGDDVLEASGEVTAVSEEAPEDSE